jgi:hypothetical protein
MASSESVINQPRLDEPLWKLRTAVLCRLATRLSLFPNKDRIEALVQQHDDAEVWRIIIQDHDRSLRSLRKLFYWRASQ